MNQIKKKDQKLLHQREKEMWVCWSQFSNEKQKQN